jgi:non-ribosomal peptide synthetase component F
MGTMAQAYGAPSPAAIGAAAQHLCARHRHCAGPVETRLHTLAYRTLRYCLRVDQGYTPCRHAILAAGVACQPNRDARSRAATPHLEGSRRARAAAARALRALGIADGRFVAALAMNSDRYIRVSFAVRVGRRRWFAPLNIRWSIAENAYALTDSKAAVLFVDDSFLDQAAT